MSDEMAFDYDELKSQEESGGNHWASYSDLFMVLSLVFLLLYVTASLRSGTFGLQKQLAYQELVKQNEDFKQQLKVYDTLKDDYLKTGASDDELETYNQLMDKLSLLQEESKDEKNKLRQQAKELEAKEFALNKYQQAVRNIINSNMLSQAKVKRRDKIIEVKDQEIEVKEQSIANLQQTITQKESEIQARNQLIDAKNAELDKKINQLKRSLEKQKITKKSYQAKMAQLKKQTQSEVEKLKQKNMLIAKDIEKYNQELQQTSAQLAQAQAEITEKEQALMGKEKEITKLLAQKSKISQQINTLQEKHKEETLAQQEAFEKALMQEKLSAQEKIRKQAEFREQLAAQKRELDKKVNELSKEVLSSQNELNRAMLAKQAADAEKAKAEQALQEASSQNAKISGDLKKAQEIINERKKLIQRIKDNFAKSGIKADVDEKTGDVVISFGDEYFDAGKATLKPQMEEILGKVMPQYTKSLLSDKKTAERVRNVEIIGFASPTYKGKYVDPVSLKAADRDAANYNLDLSFYRARAIYDHVFDPTKMTYEYQQDLLPLVKVTGRSFFAEGSEKDVQAGISAVEYCKKYDCKKAQKVLIRFDLKEK